MRAQVNTGTVPWTFAIAPVAKHEERKMEAQPLVSLTSIDIHESEPKIFDDHEAFISLLSEHDVETSRGKLRVTRQGKEGKTAIVTFHDIGQNHTSAFLGFFNFNETRPLLDQFCIYHIDAPGQQDDSEDLPAEYLYPTMDELSDMVGEVVNFFNIKRFIGFGIGAGANILCRYALWNPTRVEALVLVELVASNGGWIEWGYQKVSLHCMLVQEVRKLCSFCSRKCANPAIYPWRRYQLFITPVILAHMFRRDFSYNLIT